MKIGIIGLLAQQVAHITQKFPHQKFVFLPRDRERDAASFCQQVSKVVVMTKFISHSTFNAIPVHKREPVAGGMSDLTRKLTALSESSEPAVKKTETKKETDVPATMNWSVLKDAGLGDILTIKRPTDLSMPEFKQQVANQRSYYKRQYGIHTIVTVSGAKAVVEVVNIESLPKESTPAVVKTDAAGQLALLWANFVTHRCASGASVSSASEMADEFIEAFKKKFL